MATIKEIFDKKPTKPAAVLFPGDIPRGYDKSPNVAAIYKAYAEKVLRYSEYLEYLENYKQWEIRFLDDIHRYLYQGDLLLAKLSTRKQNIVVERVLSNKFTGYKFEQEILMNYDEFVQFVDHCEDLAQLLLDAA